MNEIFDLQRDVHANDFTLCEENTFGLRTLLCAFFFLVRESPFARCWESFPAYT